MKKSKKTLYPGIDQVERIKGTTTTAKQTEQPDFMPGTLIPNYEKFKGIAPDQVLRVLNID